MARFEVLITRVLGGKILTKPEICVELGVDAYASPVTDEYIALSSALQALLNANVVMMSLDHNKERIEASGGESLRYYLSRDEAAFIQAGQFRNEENRGLVEHDLLKTGDEGDVLSEKTVALWELYRKSEATRRRNAIKKAVVQKKIINAFLKGGKS